MRIKVLLVLALTLTMSLIMLPRVRAQPDADINGDGHVTVLDVTLAGSQYRLTASDIGYNSTIVEKADFNGNGIVDLVDMVTIIGRFTG